MNKRQRKKQAKNIAYLDALKAEAVIAWKKIYQENKTEAMRSFREQYRQGAR